jgi:hypothetical protein
MHHGSLHEESHNTERAIGASDPIRPSSTGFKSNQADEVIVFDMKGAGK